MPPVARIGDQHSCPLSQPQKHEKEAEKAGPIVARQGQVNIGAEGGKAHDIDVSAKDRPTPDQLYWQLAKRSGKIGTCVSVKSGTKPVAVIGDPAECRGANMVDFIAQGSSVVRVKGLAVARKGDLTVHMGKITEGDASVVVGGAPEPAYKVDVAAVDQLIKDGKASFHNVKMERKADGTFVVGKAAIEAQRDVLKTYAYFCGVEYAPGVRVRGSPEYREATMRTLDNLKGTPDGEMLLKRAKEAEDRSIGRSFGRKGVGEEGYDQQQYDALMIQNLKAKDPENPTALDDKLLMSDANAGNRGFAFTDWQKEKLHAAARPHDGGPSYRAFDPELSGIEGRGSGGVVNFNPDDPMFGPDKKHFPRMTPEVALGHEMCHFYYGSKGCNCRTPTKDPYDSDANSNEDAAIGIRDYEGKRPSENSLRQQLADKGLLHPNPPDLRTGHMWPEPWRNPGYCERHRKALEAAQKFENGDLFFQKITEYYVYVDDGSSASTDVKYVPVNQVGRKVAVLVELQGKPIGTGRQFTLERAAVSKEYYMSTAMGYVDATSHVPKRPTEEELQSCPDCNGPGDYPVPQPGGSRAA